MPNNKQAVIRERRERVWGFLTRGMKGYEIASELGVDPPTISRDIQYLTTESQNYIAKLAKETVPFMYQTSIEGIREIIRECWRIYSEEANDRMAALKLAKECHESMFHLISEGPFILSVKALEERLTKIEGSKSVI
jgi:IS30 family transposase